MKVETTEVLYTISGIPERDIKRIMVALQSYASALADTHNGFESQQVDNIYYLIKATVDKLQG